MADWKEQFQKNQDKDDGPKVTKENLDSFGSGMTLKEAQDKENIWRIMVWSNPGMGKTHFAYTMPQPICFIDTEGKADNIASKFDMEEHMFRLWQPEDYSEAVDALHEAIAYLDYWQSEEDKRGTIVVDSMSIMWGWAQQHYVDEWYHGKAPEKFQSGFGSGASDWKRIKDYHNKKFREVMLNTNYNLLWTAMREDDYDAIVFQNKPNADKPAGEKENVYKVNDIIKIEESEGGRPIGILQKSALTRFKYYNLEFPTFEKHKKIVETVAEGESNGADMSKFELPYDVSVAEGTPTKFEEESDED